MDLTFQVPMQYCSLKDQTLLPSPVTSTTGHCFCFGSASSFFLELFLHSSPVAYWAPTDLGSSSFSVLSFCLFILFTGFSRQEYWSGLSFSSPMDHVLSELSTLTCPSWLALHGMAHSFTELDKAVIPWMEEPGRLQSMGSLRVGHDWATSLSLSTLMQWRRKWQPIPVFLPGESHGRRRLVSCSPWAHTESDTTEAT